MTLTILLSMAFMIGCTEEEQDMNYSNIISEDRMTLVLAVPSVENTYYADVHRSIVDFHIAYAKTVMGSDNIVVVADRQTMPLLKGKLPDDILLEENIEDIWMRDFTTVIPSNPVQFNYRPSYFEDLEDAIFIQSAFKNFTNRHGLKFRSSSLILDGGNIVDNNENYAITTERFLEDNTLDLAEGQEALQRVLGMQYVAIIPYDDEVMGHADGMVMWIAQNKVLLNVYDEPFRSLVIDALKSQLPSTVEVIEAPASFDDSVWDVFSSACGVNLNATVTHQHIYMPIFDNTIDQQVIALVKTHTDKTIHTIQAKGVCFMGGSVRCLTWQIQGENARKIIEAARKE